MKRLCTPPVGMLLCLAAAAGTCAILSGCGPTYRVYNGGTVNDAQAAPSGELKPSEATVRFSSDFADSSRNFTAGGRTNRVYTDIPDTRDGAYRALVCSSAVRSVVTGAPSSMSAASAPANARAGIVETAAVSDSASTGLLSGPSQQAQVKNTRTIEGSLRSSGRVDVADVETSRAAIDAAAAAERAGAGHVQGLGDSEAFAQSAKAAQAAGATVARGPSALEGSLMTNTTDSSGTAAAHLESAVAKGHADSDAPQNLAEAGLTVAALNAEAVKARGSSAAPALKGDVRVAVVKADTNTVDYRADTDITADIGDQSFIMGVTNAGAPAAYMRRHPRISFAETDVARAAAAGMAPALRQASENTQGLSVPGGAAGVQNPRNAVDVDTARALASNKTTTWPKQSFWTKSAVGVTRVSSPRVSVLKQERMVRDRDIDSLISKGVLKERPASGATVCYRIYLFAESGSVAKDVTVTDRLDKNLRLMEGAVFTSDDEASAGYDAATRTLTVRFPRIDGNEVRVIEFYAEPARE